MQTSLTSTVHRLAILSLLLLLLVSVLPAAAQQPQPQPPAVQTECPFVLKSGVPFAWLRFAPSSYAPYTITMRPGDTVQANAPAQLVWDGVQWWLYVWPNFQSGHGYYWVELGSLEPRCQTPTPIPPTPTPPPSSGAANWQQGTFVHVRGGVPFVWFRAQPTPGSMPIHTVFAGTNLVVMSGPSQDTYGQWWWLMRDPRYSVLGWVEQNTVEVTGTTPAPVPTGWKAGDTVRVRNTVPFSWLRSTPGSASAVIFTVAPGQALILQDGPLSDNVQNWWRVAIPYSGISGWVEESSLELIRRA